MIKCPRFWQRFRQRVQSSVGCKVPENTVVYCSICVSCVLLLEREESGPCTNGSWTTAQHKSTRCAKFAAESLPVGPFTSMNGQNDIGMNNTNTIKKNDQDHDRKGDSESVCEEQIKFKIGKG